MLYRVYSLSINRGLLIFMGIGRSTHPFGCRMSGKSTQDLVFVKELYDQILLLE